MIDLQKVTNALHKMHKGFIVTQINKFKDGHYLVFAGPSESANSTSFLYDPDSGGIINYVIAMHMDELGDSLTNPDKLVYRR